jgi:hypothetical protein
MLTLKVADQSPDGNVLRSTASASAQSVIRPGLRPPARVRKESVVQPALPSIWPLAPDLA